jgi:hypothetical protein
MTSSLGITLFSGEGLQVRVKSAACGIGLHRAVTLRHFEDDDIMVENWSSFSYAGDEMADIGHEIKIKAPKAQSSPPS